MKASEIFDAGYAIPQYDIHQNTRDWRYREEQFILPAGAVPLRNFPGVFFDVAKIEDVRAAAGSLLLGRQTTGATRPE